MSSRAAVALLACAAAGAAGAAGTRAYLDGVWLFYGAQVPDDPGLTAAGREKLEQYDPLRDDTDTDCKPVTFTNIMHTPSPPIEIRLHDDHAVTPRRWQGVEQPLGALDRPAENRLYPSVAASRQPRHGGIA